MRMYFAAVAPPKPPPITTTRALEGVAVAQPATEARAGQLEEVASFSWRYLFCAANQAAIASICGSV